MNFVEERSLCAAVERRGVAMPSSPKASEQLLTKVNGLAYRVTKTALDAARMLSQTGTVKPEHFANVAKLHAMLMTPVLGGSPQRGGGPVLPGPYFGGQESSAYSRGGGPVLPGPYFGGQESSAYSRGGGPTMSGYSFGGQESSAYSRGGGPTMNGGAPDLTMPLVYFGGPETASYVPELPEAAPLGPGLVRAALSSTFPSTLMSGGGGAGRGVVTVEAVDRILKEYRARHGSSVRVSEAARQSLRRIVDANVCMAIDAAVEADAKKRRTAKTNVGGRTLGSAAFTKVANKWVLRL